MPVLVTGCRGSRSGVGVSGLGCSAAACSRVAGLGRRSQMCRADLARGILSLMDGHIGYGQL